MEKFPVILENFQDNMNIQTHVKVSFALEKFPESLETFSTIRIYSLMKNSFQTHINILDCLEQSPVLWKSFQKFWKTFQTIFLNYFMKNSFQTNINILYCLENFISSGKVSKKSGKLSRQYEFIIS